MARLFEQGIDVTPTNTFRIASGLAGSPTENTTFSTLITWLSTMFAKLKTAASGLPSSTGAGDINFSRVNDYASETALTGAVTWGITNIAADKVMAIDVKTASNVITLTEAGITFKGSVNAGGVVQNLDVVASNLISLWAQSTTIIWVTVVKNEG